MQPLIQLYNPITNNRISIYDDGRVYGSKKGQLLGFLNNESKTLVLNLIKENMYMFKRLERYDEKLNPITMFVRDDSRKHRHIKITGWSQFNNLITYIRKTESLHDIVI